MRNLEPIIVAVVGLLLIGICLLGLANCFGGQARKHIVKTLQSNTTGLEREITTYDYTGNVLGRWRGKTTINTEHNDIDFILDDKRVVIRGGITIIKEVK